MLNKKNNHHLQFKAVIISFAFGLLLSFASVVSAEEDPYGKINVDTGWIGSSGQTSAREKGMPFVNRLINFSSAVSVITLLIVIVVNGIKIINSDKGADALRQATTNILISILGLGITASAYLVTGYLGYTFYGDTTFYTDPVAHISGADALNSSSTEHNSFFSLINLLTGGAASNWLSKIGDAVPTSPNQVFGTPAPVATNGLVAQSYTSAPQSILSSVVGLLAAAASIWLLITLIWNGYKIITSSGSPDVMSKAIKTIGVSIIGFLIAVMAYLLVSFLSNRFFNNRNYLDNSHSPVNELIRSPS